MICEITVDNFIKCVMSVCDIGCQTCKNESRWSNDIYGQENAFMISTKEGVKIMLT